MDKALLDSAVIAVKDCLKAQKGEKVLVVTDSELREIGEALLEAARSLETEAMLMEIIPRERNGEE
ncbi:MAG: aminopeptidase, partial [Candidatus Krumholzibacteria bacterium]|nr:aminopeptidase [Candidatus Krumholzibacteria bacterium]